MSDKLGDFLLSVRLRINNFKLNFDILQLKKNKSMKLNLSESLEMIEQKYSELLLIDQLELEHSQLLIF